MVAVVEVMAVAVTAVITGGRAATVVNVKSGEVVSAPAAIVERAEK